MAQTIAFDEVSELAASGSSVERALDKITAALGSLGDAGAEARSVVDSLRKSLQATASQAAKSTRSLARFDEINRLAAPETEKSSSKSGSGGSSKTSGKEDTAADTAEQQLSVWQGALQSLRDLWARFWAYLQSCYAPAIAAWQGAWNQMSAAAAAVWEPLRTAALTLWNDTLLPLARYLTTEFLPGVVNSFSEAFGPIVGGALSAAITVAGNTFQWLSALVADASATILQPALAMLLTVWQGLMTGIRSAWDAYGQPLLDGIVLAFQNLTTLLQALWSGTLQPVLSNLVAQLGAFWTQTLSPLWQQLTLALGAVSNLLLTLWNTILAPLLTWLVSVLGPVFTQVFAAVSTAVGTALNMASGAVTSLLAVLRGLADFVSSVLQGRWSDAWNAMLTTVVTVWNTITATVTNAINGLLTALQHLAWSIQAVFDGFRHTLSGIGSAASGALSAAGQWITGRSAAPQLAYAQSVAVPALASGAVIPPNRAFLALLGDQHSGTNIEAPLVTIEQAVAGVMADVQAGQMAGFETLAALLRDLLEAVGGIELTDEMVGRAAQRWTRRSNLQRGGVTV
ncbi:hypothetical protein [Subdoligranulum variabile]|uniref:TMP repeat protein n=1 Tax=Subdoligranulum variabile DSM 15176 TaxID=411471 RepID=D1PRA5_9FIRM|nr:hypothetical protein [Subdoligranulum variabile]EFB74807.1 hypothetical protein SUBVAR_06934 [Subdoligranulum variabile DSM 15176]UWP66969.1 hypothetical protein NQ490_08405 [Subdoligranulum variabile]